MSTPEVEIGKATGLVAFGMLLVKAAQVALRSFATGKSERLSEIDRALAAQEKFNDQVLKDNRELRDREDELEARVWKAEERTNAAENDLRKCRLGIEEIERRNTELVEENAALKKELKLWRAGVHSPKPGNGGSAS